MKQKLRRFMAGFLAILTMFTTLFTNGTTAFAVSSSANIAFWVASSKDPGVISEFNSKHTGSILYAMIDGHSAYCMNFGLSAKGGQLMNSDSNPNTNLSAAQERLLAYCMYYGYSTTEAKAPTNDQRNKFIATQSMVWITVNGIFGTSSADSAASKLCACAPDSSSSYSYYETFFVNGSLNIFNHQTNVDVDNRFVVYGIRDLGTELSPITMLVMMESIQQRIVENGKRGKATWLYIDEFHVLLNSEYSAKYLQQHWKKVRKQGGLCTGITQNVIDLLQNYTATTMLANSEFLALLKQANTDSSKMAEVIGVSDAQLRFVTNSQSGMGLLKCGNVVIPFDNQIGKDTSLYKLYNTNIHEKIAEQRAKEQQR